MARRATSHRVHRLTIALDGTNPPVWRRVEVPSVTRLDELHTVIQAVMGWNDEHLHTFEFGGRRYSGHADDHPGFGPPDRDERAARVGDVLRRPGSQGTYGYDFGDDWRHTITVEDVGEAATGTVYPRFLDGHGGCPPEDCGGAEGYEHLRHLRDHPDEIQDGSHGEAEEQRAWVGLLAPDDLEVGEIGEALRAAVGALPLDEPADAAARADPARPVTLPPADELARTALDAPLLLGAVRLARWTAPSRKLTGTGVPRPTDARAAVEELDLWPVVSEKEATERAEALRHSRTARDLLDFLLPWEAAVELGLVEVRATTARPTGAVHGLEADPERVLDLWTDLFEAVIEGPPTPGGYRRSGIDGSDVLPPTLRSLYEAPDGTEFPLAELAGALVPREDGVSLFPAPDAERWEELMTEILYAAVHELAGIGAVRLTDRTPPPLAALYRPGHTRSRVPDQAEEEAAHAAGVIDCSVALTPLGRFGTRELLLGWGIPAPLSGSLATAGADELLDALAALPREYHTAEVTPWAANRTADEAVREIAEAAAAPTGHGAARRALGAMVLNSLGERTAPALRALLGSDRRTMVGLAASALLSSDALSREEGRRMFSEHGPWMVIDTVAGPMELGEYQVSTLFALNEEADGGSIGRMVLETADDLWRVDHPQTVTALETLGRLHPDRRVAKAARRAAHKARSRG
ncbi:plasmid pRiA4b ORF-3 family protein [Nocardiopsis lucentensis]|uniref:plasmid pRiA4b ORF-3 family protein n=1 Tax=Nocardiopsis lucentensis TaxID=53441 RepID=UPI00034C04B7|nr:plasmid pRiA4b ORF-3 family protein [Nocardiopsis lucentensis]